MRHILIILVMIIVFSGSTIMGEAQEESCYDIDPYNIDVVVPAGNGSRTTQRQTQSACCPNENDCVYDGECYAEGTIIESNPRYACGPNNNYIEALDIDYQTTDEEHDQQSVSLDSNVYEVQHSPSYNQSIIVCNSADQEMPQRWTTRDDCKSGEIELLVEDGPSGSIIDSEIEFRIELYTLGSMASQAYTNFTIEQIDDRYILDGLLGSYMNIIVEAEGGNMGSLNDLRINHDEGIVEHSVATYRDNTCNQCIDYSLGTGLCSMDCEGRGLGDICEFKSDEIMEKCHMRAPGTQVTLDNGTRVECCNRPIGPKLPDIRAEVSCEMDNLVRKEYNLEWRGRPLTLVVTSCGE